MTSSHNKIINAAARRLLKPLGLKRKGSSRIWFRDLGWRVIQVEFQPSAWSKGSYLNVGISWLLYEKPYLSFDVGYRIDTPFIEYASDDQFEPAALEMAQRAASEVTELQAKFGSLHSAAEHYRNEKLASEWSRYYAGVIFGLTGMVAESRDCFSTIANMPTDHDWQRGLAYKASDLLGLLGNYEQFRNSIIGVVYRARSAADLDRWEGELEF